MPYGTGETFFIEEVRELLSRGHQVYVVPRSPGRRLAHSLFPAECLVREGLCSYRVVRDALGVSAALPRSIAAAARPLLQVRSAALRMKNLAVVPKALWLARLATRLKADHIHCHWAGTTASMAMLAAALSDISWSLTAHRWDIVENNALQAKVSSASFVRVISGDGLRLMGSLGIEPRRIRVLRMGVRIPAGHESEIGRWTPPPSPVVLCPANLVEVKGHRFLIEAWRILRDRGFDGELWLAGDGELKPSLEKLAARMHPDGRVKFLGRVGHERLLGFYRSGIVSAVVLASVDLGQGSHEGIPVALMEAMGYGVPVVATDSGGIRELVNSQTGILAPPGDPAALADGLERALTGGTNSQHLASLGRRYVAEHHDVVSIAATLEQWFQEAVAGQVARGTLRVRRIGNPPAAAGCAAATLGEPVASFFRRKIQPGLERLTAAVALIGFSPVLAIAAAAVLLETGRPVLFRQIRVGRAGEPFSIFKLRSMRVGPPGSSITAGGDPRVSRVGAVLRRYKLDELPQLWNIMRGEMQFVGPRPELPSFVEPGNALWRAVLREKPGLTDLSTLVYRNEEDILARRSDPERAYREELLPRKLALNASYRRVRSLGADCKLVLLTARYSFLPYGFDPDRIVKTFLEQI